MDQFRRKQGKKKKKKRILGSSRSQLKRVRKFTELLLIVWIEKKESLEKVETNGWIERNENEDEKMKDQKKKKKGK
jgi:hypothetical protein